MSLDKKFIYKLSIDDAKHYIDFYCHFLLNLLAALGSLKYRNIIFKIKSTKTYVANGAPLSTLNTSSKLLLFITRFWFNFKIPRESHPVVSNVGKPTGSPLFITILAYFLKTSNYSNKIKLTRKSIFYDPFKTAALFLSDYRFLFLFHFIQFKSISLLQCLHTCHKFDNSESLRSRLKQKTTALKYNWSWLVSVVNKLIFWNPCWSADRHNLYNK